MGSAKFPSRFDPPTSEPAELQDKTRLPQPPRYQRAEEGMDILFDLMRNFEAFDGRFLTQVAATILLLTVGRDVFVQQWSGGRT